MSGINGRENMGIPLAAEIPAALGPDGVKAVFGPAYLDEDRCREWVLGSIHGAGAFCPGCGRPVDGEKRLHRFWTGKRLSYIGCGKKFTAMTGTCLSGMHLNFTRLFCLLFLLSVGCSVVETAKRIGCDPTTVRNWRRRLAG